MSPRRVLLLGHPPPAPGSRRLGFPNLRTAHFLEALRAAGHRVALLAIEGRGFSPPEPAGKGLLRGSASLDAASSPALRRWIESWNPEAVVSAGPHLPARLAVALAGERPLWVDVPGDPFAEAQARRWAPGEPEPGRPYEDQLLAAVAALGRADALSAVSRAQRHALLGQLGLLGRLDAVPPGTDWVHALPIAWGCDGLEPAPPRRRAPRSPLTVLLAGGFNAWLDDGTLLRGLLLAAERLPGLRVVAAGGELPGHYVAGWRRFAERVRVSPHAGRFVLRGWLSQEELSAELARAHLLVNLDRPGPEAELGSRTRLLFALRQGLSVAGTPLSELAAELAREGWLHPLPPGEPEALAELLARLWERGQDGAEVAAAQAALAGRYEPRRLAQPLLAWIEAPRRLPPGRGPLESLQREAEALRAELAAWRASPTFRLGNALHRALLRLLPGARRSPARSP